MKRTIIAALGRVDHYEDHITRRPVDAGAPGARSVGLSYKEIQQQAQVEFPGKRITLMTIRSYARDAKQQGQKMPYRRPYSKRVDRTMP